MGMGNALVWSWLTLAQLPASLDEIGSRCGSVACRPLVRGVALLLALLRGLLTAESDGNGGLEA